MISTKEFKNFSFDNYLFRASSNGKLMVGKDQALTKKQAEKLAELQAKGSKSKERAALEQKVEDWNNMSAYEKLSDTVITYLKECYIQAIYGRRKEIDTWAMQKGTEQEEKGITLLTDIDGKFYVKNEKWYKNDFICGTPDIVYPTKSPNIVRDIKVSWDIFTFFANDDPFTSKDPAEIISKDYYYQLQSYMALVDVKEAILDYCLIDTPDYIIRQMERKLYWDEGYKSEDDINYLKACEQLEKRAKYGDIPNRMKHIGFSIERNDEDIEAMYRKVKLCRQWLNDYHKTQIEKL